MVLCVQGYTVFNFFIYVINFLGSGGEAVEEVVARLPQQRHLFPFCFLKPW